MNRRKILKLTASGITLSNVPVVAGTDSEYEEKSASDVGVRREVKSLIEDGEIQDAKEMCKKHNIQYQSSSHNAVSAQDAFSDDKCTLEVVCFYSHDENGDQVWTATVVATLNLDEWDFSSDSGPTDGLCLTWDSSQYQPVSQSSSNFRPIERDDATYDLLEYQDYNRYGVWAKINDNKYQNVKLIGVDGTIDLGFHTKLERLKMDNSYNINGQYVHTWCPGGGCGVLSTINFGPVGIQVGGFAVQSWRMEETTRP